MNNGLYSIVFQTQIGAGAGVLTLRDGKITGGDSRLYYVGDYTVSGDAIKASIKVDKHTDTPGMGSVFGADKLTLTITGTSSGDTANITAIAKEAPGVSLRGRLSRIAD